MEPDASAAPAFLISQDELSHYKQLETVARRYGRDLARARDSIAARMGGPGLVEPGPYNLQVVFKDTGLYTQDDDGETVPLINRYLLVYEDADDENFVRFGDADAA